MGRRGEIKAATSNLRFQAMVKKLRHVGEKKGAGDCFYSKTIVPGSSVASSFFLAI